MVPDLIYCVQRPLNYAIVDEVDNILIDEARTPLIISGQAEESAELYERFARVVPRLKPKTDYTIDQKTRTVAITEDGIDKIEQALGVDNIYADMELTRHLENALKAHALFKLRQRLHGARRRGADRRRVHRPRAGRAGATARVCTRPSRPRKASRSSARTARWRPSPSRTTSASTRSSPA